MSRVHVHFLLIVAACAVLVLPAHGQAVVSTRAGVIHDFEGAVSVAGQPLEARFGRFESIPEGADLTTGQGKAEVLLTPGVLLRVGDNSAIRMLATALSDTRVELLSGSAVVDSGEPVAGTAVTVVYKDWKVQMPHQGAYRIDNDPPRILVREGEARVATAAGDAPVLVEQGMQMAFAAAPSPEKTLFAPNYGLAAWADGRNQSISADNSIAANIQDPADLANPYGAADSFTYFPMLGYPGLGATYSALASPAIYGAASPLYQPGFYSLSARLHLPPDVPAFAGCHRPGGGTLLYPTLRYGAPGTSLPYIPVSPRPITPVGLHPVTPVTVHPVPPPRAVPVAPHPVVIHK